MQPPSLKLSVARVSLDEGDNCVITQDDRVIGLLAPQGVKETPRDAWPVTRVTQAMIPVTQVKPAQPDEGLLTALEEMEADQVNQLPVMVDGRILRVLSRDDILGFLRIARELGVQSTRERHTMI